MRLRWEHLPERVVTGVYMIHAGWGKLRAGEEQAKSLHGMASGTYPTFEQVPPATFAKALGAGEIGLGALLLAPNVSPFVAGAGLTAFSGGLIGLYWNTPGMHEENSIWPTQQGTALAKDSWLVAIGLSLMLGGVRPAARRGRLSERARRKAEVKVAKLAARQAARRPVAPVKRAAKRVKHAAK